MDPRDASASKKLVGAISRRLGWLPELLTEVINLPSKTIFSDNESFLSLMDFLSPHSELRVIESIHFSKSITVLKIPIKN